MSSPFGRSLPSRPDLAQQKKLAKETFDPDEKKVQDEAWLPLAETIFAICSL